MTDYRDILDSIDRGIVTVDLQGKITSCNRALEDILEVEAKTIVGHSLEDAFRREDPLTSCCKNLFKKNHFSRTGTWLIPAKKAGLNRCGSQPFPSGRRQEKG